MLRTVKNRPVRIGVVGCGVVADYGHIPAIHRLQNEGLAKLTAFADPIPERREAQSRKYGGLPAFASMAEMVEQIELDAVAIPTPPSVKLELVQIAAAHGLHAFCEKPLTDSVTQAEELVRIMDAASLFVGVAFIYRGKIIVQRMMELVREGTIGELKAVHIENMWDYHGWRSEQWGGAYKGRRTRSLQNMGTLDCGVHDLDLARYLSSGEFGRISAIGSIVEPTSEFPDHIVMHARMSNSVLVSIEESAVWGHTAKETPRYQQSYRMVGDNGVLKADLDFASHAHESPLYIISGEKQWTESLSADKAWDDTYRQFFQIILGEQPRHCYVANGHDALANMRVACEVINQCLACA